jgi:hypothetical protein
MIENVKKKRYWVISQLFYPDENSTGFVMTKIAEKLAEDAEVNVLCGPANYQSSDLTTKRKLDERIKVTRVKMPQVNKNNLILRLYGFILFTIGVLWKILWKVKKKDTIVVVTNPPILILLLTLVKRKNKLIVIIHDVFPDNLVVTGIIKKESILFRILRKLFDVSYQRANHLIALGEDMKAIFSEKVRYKVPVTVIPTWADHEEVFSLALNRESYFGIPEINKKIVLQFSGNIGRVQGLEKFVELFTKVTNENIFLIIIGDGAFKARLQAIQRTKNAQNIIFLPSKPRTEQNNFINGCDMGLVTLSPGMYGLGVPSKVYNIFSAGKPVLYIGDYDSQVYRYIKRFNVGWAFTWEEEEVILSFLENLKQSDLGEFHTKGQAARLLVEQRFTRDKVLEQYKLALQ